MPMNDDKNRLPALFVVLAVAMALRIAFMTRCFFDPEELIEFSVTRISSFGDFFQAAIQLDKGFIDLFFLRALSNISSNELFLRSGELVLNLIFLLIAWRVLVEITESAEAAMIGIIIIALSPLHTYYSCILRYQNLSYIFTALSILYFWRLMFRPYRALNVVMYGAMTALCCMSHYYGFFFVAAQFITFAALKAKQVRDWPKMALAAVMAGVFFLPWLPIFLKQLARRGSGISPAAFNISNRFGASLLNIPDVFFQFVTGEYYNLHGDRLIEKFILYTCFISLLACLGLFLSVLFRRQMSRGMRFSTILLSSVILIGYFSKNITDVAFHTKYLIPYSILFYAILAMLIASIKNKSGQLAAAALLMLPLGVSQVYMQVVASDADNIRNTARLVANSYEPDDVVITPGVKCGKLFSYYMNTDKNIDLRIWNYADKSRVLLEQYYDISGIALNSREDLRELMRGHKRAWVFYCLMGPRGSMDVFNRLYDPEGILPDWFGSNMTPSGNIIFKTSPRENYFLGRVFLFVR